VKGILFSFFFFSSIVLSVFVNNDVSFYMPHVKGGRVA